MANETYTYDLGNATYINLTNRCNGNCVFCVRRLQNGVGGYDLHLTHEPAAHEVIAELEEKQPQQIVFCGYGEPTICLPELTEIAKWAKERRIKTRLDTNGLGSTYHQKDIVPELASVMDEVSISLNAPNRQRYQQITRCQYGESGFEDMLRFARRCRQEGIDVTLTVVDILMPEEIQACRALAEDIPAHFRVRGYIGPTLTDV